MNQPYFEPQSPAVPVSGLPAASANKQFSADYFLKLANRHYNNFLTRGLKRDLATAVHHYRQALDLNPGLPEAQVKLASALWDQGGITLESAISQCRMAVQINPDYGEGYLFLGYFLRRAGRLEEAMAQFRLAVAKAGKSSPAKAKMALGRTLIQKAALAYDVAAWQRLGLAAEGMRQFSVGCLSLPRDKSAFQALQQAFCTDAAILGLTGLGRLMKTVGLPQQTCRLYEFATRRLPQEPIFFHLLGDMQTEADSLDGAIYYYNRASELDPDNPQLNKKLGKAYSRCQDSLNAARSLEKVIEAEAGDFETVYALAQIYTDRTEYIRALYHYKELLREAPDNPYVHSNMAYVLFKLEDYDGAIQEYQSAVNFGEDPVWTATVAQTLGTIYYQIKRDLVSAAGMFQMACQLDAGNLESLAMLGDIYTEQGEYEAAIGMYRQILSVQPNNADCYNFLGYLLWQLDKNDEAVAAYRRAIELDRQNPIAYNNLGVIFLDEKCQLDQALDMFEQAWALKPDYTLACFNVARTREAMGQTAEAARTYTDALNLNALNAEINEDEILERLENLFQV